MISLLCSEPCTFRVMTVPKKPQTAMPSSFNMEVRPVIPFRLEALDRFALKHVIVSPPSPLALHGPSKEVVFLELEAAWLVITSKVELACLQTGISGVEYF